MIISMEEATTDCHTFDSIMSSFPGTSEAAPPETWRRSNLKSAAAPQEVQEVLENPLSPDSYRFGKLCCS